MKDVPSTDLHSDDENAEYQRAEYCNIGNLQSCTNSSQTSSERSVELNLNMDTPRDHIRLRFSPRVAIDQDVNTSS